MLPDLVSDLKVFVGLYQVLTGMGQTLRIQYPVLVEEFFSWVRSLVHFDFFSIPALGCVIGTGAYVKFWTTMAIPLAIVLIVQCIYKHQLRQAHHGLEDLAVDVKETLEEANTRQSVITSGTGTANAGEQSTLGRLPVADKSAHAFYIISC